MVLFLCIFLFVFCFVPRAVALSSYCVVVVVDAQSISFVLPSRCDMFSLAFGLQLFYTFVLLTLHHYTGGVCSLVAPCDVASSLSDNSVFRTVIHRITTFRQTMYPIYDRGPIRLLYYNTIVLVSPTVFSTVT